MSIIFYYPSFFHTVPEIASFFCNPFSRIFCIMKLPFVLLLVCIVCRASACIEYAACTSEEEALALFNTQMKAKENIDKNLITTVCVAECIHPSVSIAHGGPLPQRRSSSSRMHRRKSQMCLRIAYVKRSGFWEAR